MALVLANRVQESATANTTVSFTLTGAVTGFQTFAVIGDTNTTYYSATDTSGNWEVGLGTYSTTGPTLTRTTIYASSNAGNAVTFSGTVNVFVTYPSGRSVNLDASGNVSALGTVSSGTWQGSTVGVAYGGTGVTTSSGANSVVLRDADQNITVNRVSQSNTSTTAAGGTTALTAASSYIHTLVGTGGQTYTMPDATTLTTGVAFVFNNMATGTLTLQNFAAGAIGTIPAGGAGAVFLTANSTTGGTWDIHAYLPEGVTFGTNAFNLGSSVVSGGTWQGGTIQPAYGGTGLTTFTGANNALYSTGASTLTAGTLPVVAGGTGLSTIASTRIPYATATDTLGTSSTFTFNGSSFSAPNISTTGSLTVTGAVSFNATSSAIQVSPSQSTTTITIGGPSGTGAITLGRSTGSQTTDIQAGATASGSTKTINFGTGGLSGSTTTMAIGSTNGTTVTANGTWNYTGAITSTNASGILTRAAANQDGVHIYGRAGGTGNFEVIITPTTLSADRTLTLPDNSGTVLTTGATVTVAQGGTGATSLTANNVLLGNGTSAVQVVAPGANGNVLTSNGTTWTSAAPTSSFVGSRGQAFTSNGTFTIPTGITAIKITVVGGGGGGGGASRITLGCCASANGGGGGGGGGGSAISFLTGLTPGNTLSVTIGGAGSAGSSGPGAGGSGGNSTVSSGTQTITTITANGGAGGSVPSGGSAGSGAGGAGGTSSSGTINMTGQGGIAGTNAGGGAGGSSILGGGARGIGMTGANAGVAGGAYGGGGSGGATSQSTSVAGGAGAAGVVIFEW